MPKSIHKVQQDIIDLAKRDDISQYGYRKLGELIGVDHPQKVKWHLQKLLKDGHLVRDNFGKILAADEETNPKLARIPILGLANCGQPLSFADNTIYDYLTLSPSLVKQHKQNSLFAVQATGDSMNACSIENRPIEDGDYVIVDASVEVPKTGDYVVSSIEGMANIKRFVRDETNQCIALVSESTRPRPPIIVSDEDLESYRVHGKVVGVIKSYA